MGEEAKPKVCWFSQMGENLCRILGFLFDIGNQFGNWTEMKNPLIRHVIIVEGGESLQSIIQNRFHLFGITYPCIASVMVPH